jgi:hypothetical protein
VTRPYALLFFGLVALTTGCGSGAVEAPMVPARTAEHETRSPRRSDHPHPRLIAPPPAYGNKVVMARAASDATLN